MVGKRQKCEAYKVLGLNIKRGRAFLRIFDVDRTQGRPSSDENELLRGAVVYAVAALDAFLHDLVLEIVPQFGGDRSGLKDALRAIAKDDPGLSLRMAISPNPTGEFETALSEWLENKSFQGAEKVANAATYIGCTVDWEDISSKAGTKAAARLEYFTDMRHQIVHRGTTPRITRPLAEECVNLVEAIAETINTEAVKWYP